MFDLTLWGTPKADDDENRGRKRALTSSATASTTLKRARTPNPPVPLVNPNIDPITGKLRVLNQPNRRRTPPATAPTTTTTPSRTFTLPISPPKPNTQAEYDKIKERLKAHGDSYKAGTRPSEGYLRRQYELNIEGERTRIRLEAGKSKDTAIVLDSDDDDEDAFGEADDSYGA